MGESFEEYVARIEGYLGKRRPKDVLRATPGRLARRVGSVSPKVLAAKPAPRKWSIAQILAHLADTELFWAYRVRSILASNGVALVGVDQDRWAKSGRYERADPGVSLETFRAIRAANLGLLRRLPASALARYGAHSQFGKLSISRILRLMAGHDLNHEAQIASALQRPRKRGVSARPSSR